MIRVVLDTNVIVAGLRSKQGASYELLQRLGNPKREVEFALSPSLLLEYESVLKRPECVPLTLKQIGDLLDYWCGIGVCRQVRFRVRPATVDASDDLVLEAAIATKNGIIVTHDLKHLLSASQQYGVEVQTPQQALAEWRLIS